MSKKGFPPIHPGETLLEDLMKPLGLSQNKLAKALGVDHETDQRNCDRAAFHYRRHGFKTCAVFWDESRVLDEPSDAV